MRHKEAVEIVSHLLCYWEFCCCCCCWCILIGKLARTLVVWMLRSGVCYTSTFVGIVRISHN